MRYTILFLLSCLCFPLGMKGQEWTNAERSAMMSQMQRLRRSIEPASLSEKQKKQCEEFFLQFYRKQYELQKKIMERKKMSNSNEPNKFIQEEKELVRLQKDMPVELKKLLNEEQLKNYVAYHEKELEKNTENRRQMALNQLKQQVSPPLSEEQEQQVLAYYKEREASDRKILEKYDLFEMPYSQRYYRSLLFWDQYSRMEKILTKEQYTHYLSATEKIRNSHQENLKKEKERMEEEQKSLQK